MGISAYSCRKASIGSKRAARKAGTIPLINPTAPRMSVDAISVPGAMISRPKGTPAGEAGVAEVSQPGMVMGTFQYMSPEQVQGKDADARSDIFSFGLVLYELLAGERAFTGDSPASVIAAILDQSAPSLPSAAPPELEWLLHRCLVKDRSEEHTSELQ